jgi:non-specific protein-tyrosine kinase
LIRDREKIVEWIRHSLERGKALAGRLKIPGKRETQAYRRSDLTSLSKLDASMGFSPQYSKSRPVQLNPNFVADNRCIAILSNAPEIEPYRVLRTQMLHRLREMGGKTVMITSAVPDEGKTITAVNLALTIAKDFHETVLLVDADLRKQKVHAYLGIESDKGLVDYLTHDEPVGNLIIWPGIDKLTLISGGAPIWERAELLGSLKMKQLVQEMRERYADRYVFLMCLPS